MVGQILSFMPDWLLFFIGAIILIIVYAFMPQDLKEGTKKFLKNWGVYIVLLLFWLYFKNKWGLVSDQPQRWPANINYATFIVGLILLLYFGVKSWLYEQRYYTNHFICDNVSGSCHRYQEIGDADADTNWIVFFLGTSGTSDERFVIPWPWTKRIVVVPKCACQFLGNQMLAKSQVHKVDLYDLPPSVKHFIETDTFGKFCQEELYFGLWDVEIRAKNPKYNVYEHKFEEYNARLSEADDMLKGKLTRTKGFISDTIAMTDKVKGKSWLRRDRGQQPQDEG